MCYTLTIRRWLDPLEGVEPQAMSDRAFLFLFSIFMIVVAGASVAYLIVTGQAATVDGLFLVITALTIAAGFALYAVYQLRMAMEATKSAAQPAKATAPSSTVKTAPAQS